MSHDIQVSLMSRCLELAARAEGKTHPNPMVGAVVADEDGKIFGEGFHEQAGKPHAEVMALQAAGDRARGATLYVSLEPCCHSGRTPPCTDRIIESGITRVVAAITDPNPKVAGRGFELLAKAGIDVQKDVLLDRATWLNRGFIKTITSSIPWLCLKMASTLDGRVADRFGESKWITSEEARICVHQLRNRFDAVLIGAETGRRDNPHLNVRGIEGSRQPARIVLDTNLTIKDGSHLLDPVCGGPTFIYCSENALSDDRREYDDSITIVRAPLQADRTWIDPAFVLEDLGQKGFQKILCEGGSRLAGSLLAADLVDEVLWFVAPALLPDTEATTATRYDEAISIKEMRRFKHLQSSSVGPDTLVHLARA